jgi:hypothetical protein
VERRRGGKGKTYLLLPLRDRVTDFGEVGAELADRVEDSSAVGSVLHSRSGSVLLAQSTKERRKKSAQSSSQCSPPSPPPPAYKRSPRWPVLPSRNRRRGRRWWLSGSKRQKRCGRRRGRPSLPSGGRSSSSRGCGSAIGLVESEGEHGSAGTYSLNRSASTLNAESSVRSTCPTFMLI